MDDEAPFAASSLNLQHCSCARQRRRGESASAFAVLETGVLEASVCKETVETGKREKQWGR